MASVKISMRGTGGAVFSGPSVNTDVKIEVNEAVLAGEHLDNAMIALQGAAQSIIFTLHTAAETVGELDLDDEGEKGEPEEDQPAEIVRRVEELLDGAVLTFNQASLIRTLALEGQKRGEAAAEADAEGEMA